MAQGGRAITKELAALAAQIHAVDEDGNPVTRERALADLLWKMALGWEEITRDDFGNIQKTVHKPAAWAMQYIVERTEGKAPIAQMDNSAGMKAADKVRELSTARINALSASVVGPPSRKK